PLAPPSFPTRRSSDLIANRPADEGHPYGHHKAEYFSSGFEGILIIAAALAIGWAAVGRLLAPQPLERLGWGMALSVASAGLNAADRKSTRLNSSHVKI